MKPQPHHAWPGYHTHFQLLPEMPIPVDPTQTLREAVDEIRDTLGWKKKEAE